MSFTQLNFACESLAEDDDMDVEIEFYNMPDTRIIEMLNDAYFDSE